MTIAPDDSAAPVPVGAAVVGYAGHRGTGLNGMPADRSGVTRLFHDGVLTACDVAVGDLLDRIDRPDAIAWLDLQDAGVEDLKALDAAFELHELAIADALGEPERPRVSHYANHLFVTAQPLGRDVTGGLHATALAVFVLPRVLITVRAPGGLDIDAVAARWRLHPAGHGGGAALPLYALLDEVVAGHLEVLEALDDRVDGLEDLVFDESADSIRAVQRQLFGLRKELALLRRAALPMRDVVLALLRSGSDLVPAPLAVYYQDVHDRVLRAAEWSESLRELVTSVVETNLTVQSNRTNTMMKKITSWAAIIAVPTAITGFYGQNVPYPGSGQPAGVLTSLVLIVVSSVVLYAVFRHREWL